ncbi:methionyl-tRNA formyltransferase [Denitromonas iodatirespirans]|uniref:Methionyl-tRNA formyltransferase n=1 Tax=Denitromonas iodatirespirans TaxID=2795389 RepID=A0A944D7G0_DENI1|nr:methionyl-tRNA formyltransferase [Denitromonas iodatirespirans]MBT0959911.1 methionyl-tRNA formyltransferase [Denitromonas iodatirespirans]
MRIAFAGTPEFAATALRALIDGGFEVVLVLTQPDRPAGRGMKLQPSAVKQVALAHGIPVDQPEKLRTSEQQAALRAAAPDVLVVAAYGLILPQAVLDIPRIGCLNIHASLLPRWRGAAPIHRAIEAGDAETGITIMKMDAGLDTGDMLLRQAVPIPPDATTATLHDTLAALGGEMIVDAICRLAIKSLEAEPQPAEGVTYAHKIDKAEARLDWRRPAVELARQVRAFDPFPGAVAEFDGRTFKLWQATAVDATGTPGTILRADADGLLIACGAGALNVTQLQQPGGRRVPAAAFLQGFALTSGQQLALPTAD